MTVTDTVDEEVVVAEEAGDVMIISKFCHFWSSLLLDYIIENIIYL
jgi:hypothetical protein